MRIIESGDAASQQQQDARWRERQRESEIEHAIKMEKLRREFIALRCQNKESEAKMIAKGCWDGKGQ